jgi:hypothetical protein
VGLIVAVPLTVCLVVAGNYIPQLRFLSILLGDRSTLSIQDRVYQRLLALDDDEVGKLTAEYLKAKLRGEFYEDVLIPVLGMTERDRHAGRLSDIQERFVLETARELAGELSSEGGRPRPPGEERLAQRVPLGRILCIPTGDEADAIAATMLGQLLAQEGLQYATGSPDLLTSEFVQRVREEQCDLVVISAVPPLATHRARYLCKRLRQHHPELPIIVGLWYGRGSASSHESLTEVGATCVVNCLSDAVTQARRTLSALRASAAAASPAAAG